MNFAEVCKTWQVYCARYNKIGKDIFSALGFIFFNYIHS